MKEIIPQKVQEFRKKYQKENSPKFYHGWVHYGANFVFAISIATYCISKLENVQTWELISIPCFALLANFVEYWAHRSFLHRIIGPIKLPYKEHTLMHHYYFTDQAMIAQGHQDFHRVLFNPPAVILFVVLIGLPTCILLGKTVSANFGYLSFTCAGLYFLLYETMHMIFHFPEDHWVYKIPGLKFLRMHHLIHHDLGKMARKNFNVVLPIFDFLFGTLETSKSLNS